MADYLSLQIRLFRFGIETARLTTNTSRTFGAAFHSHTVRRDHLPVEGT